MNFKYILSISILVFFLFFNSACLSGVQRGELMKMRNNDTFDIGLNEAVVIKNIWKDQTLEDWNIKIKVLTIEERRAQIQIFSPTFFGEDYHKTNFIELGRAISIIQAEEVTTKIELRRIVKDKITLLLRIQSAPPAPEVLEIFDVIKNQSANSGNSGGGSLNY